MQKERDVQKRKETALKTSILEGSAANFSSGIGDTYIVPLANALKATSVHIGLLNALTGLVAPLAQVYGDKLLQTQSRKKIVRRFVLLQALTWLPIALLSLLFWRGIAQEYLPIALIVLYTLLAALGGIAYPAWFSWMGDLVPQDARGKYFGKRTRITGTVGLIAVLAGGLLWDLLKTQGHALLAFSILFSIAAIARLISYLFFKNQYAPPFKSYKKDYFSLPAFLKRLDNYGKFALGHAFFNFALMIASPFFALYMLRELNLSPIMFAVISMSSTVFHLLFAPLVGKISDKYGNQRLFALSCILFSINPLVWMVVKNQFILIGIQIVAGFANAAMGIAVTNFTYDAVKPNHRALCITYTNILAGIGVFIGSILGGLLIAHHPAFMSGFMFVFLVSALLRWAVSLFLIPKIKEQKKVKQIHIPHFHPFHPFKSVHAEVHWLRGFMKQK